MDKDFGQANWPALLRICERFAWTTTVSIGLFWLGLLALMALTLLATLNLALRIPSRTRLADRFEKHGLEHRFDQFINDRPKHMLATAMLRTMVSFALLLIILVEAEVFTVNLSATRTVVASITALGLVLVFGVAIPHAWAKYASESWVVTMLPVLSMIRFFCYPLTVTLHVIDPVVRRLVGVPVRDAKSYADELEQEILDMVSEGERHGAVDEQEKEMIESVIELTDTRVEEIMTPRTEMVAMSKNTDLETVRKTIRAKGHSRIPVYEETVDTILGVLYAKDLLLRDDHIPFDLPKELRRALFIPETKPVRELLREFQTQKVHIAIVLDEYGGTAGLVTIEDILEELVGDITDEYDPTVPVELKRIDEETVEVDARMRIDDLNDQLNLELPEDEDFETIGGMVFSRLGKIPQIGAQWKEGPLVIDVVGAEPRRITRLKLKVAKAGSDHEKN